jgi:hypothetical protein
MFLEGLTEGGFGGDRSLQFCISTGSTASTHIAQLDGFASVAESAEAY